MIAAATAGPALQAGILRRAAPRLTQIFCATLGLFLLLESGTMGLIFAGTDFTVGDRLPHERWNFFFEFNSWHHALHITSGALLVVAALKKEWAPVGAIVFGTIYAVMAPLGFIDGDDVLDVFYSGPRENAVHALLATAGILLGLAPRLVGTPEPRHRSSREALASTARSSGLAILASSDLDTKTTPATQPVDVVVVGGGPAGLGVAALLTRRGFAVIVLEREQHIVPKWRAGYDRLRINTSSWFSYLPGRRFPRATGRWLSRDELVAYYDDYAAKHGLEIRTGLEAKRIDRSDGCWIVETENGTLKSRAVVVATGKQDTPVIPPWPGREDFKGELIHSAAYRNALPYSGRRVLVVGVGNSGMDIALDLVEGGAQQVWISVRRPPHIMRREVLGLPHDVFGVLSRRSPTRMADSSAKLLRRLTVGDLSEYGLPIPNDGPVSRLEKDGKVPTVDPGEFAASVRARRLTVVGGVASFEQGSVVLTDGTRIPAQAVVCATGYRPSLEPLAGHLGLLDEQGLPLVHGSQTHPFAPRIHFIGFVDPRSGLLRELRLEARKVSRVLGRQLAAGR